PAPAAIPPAAAPVPAAPPGPPPVVAATAAPVVSMATAQTGAQTAHYLQAGLFKDPINAVTMREQLSGMGILNVWLKNELRNGISVSRVLIGPFADENTLSSVRKRLSEVQLPALPVIE
ncbi:MAG: SPOR domain-containing protein, partial [Nevskia sp.]|nr:SPOR domain-containing protein [Nevskia sp.]